MRPFMTVLALPFAAVVALAPPAAAAETTRTLKLDLAPAGRFAVENLAGTMRVTSGPGDKVVAVATVHAESDQLADSIRLEQVSGEEGVTTLRVIYPVDRYTTYRYPGEDRKDDSWSGGWLSGWLGGSSTGTKYAGHRVKVSSTSGVMAYADVEVTLPRREIDGILRNLVGRIDASNVEGTLRFDSASGDVTLQKGRGHVTAYTASGDVKASDIEGAFTGHTGSGDIDLNRFNGDEVKCDTGSGDVSVDVATARKVTVDTGSGDVDARGVDAEEIAADTGSGNVTLQTRGGRLARVKADTGSGDVTVRLEPDASFEAMASIGSGDLVSRFRDAQPIVRNKEVVGYRRGDAKTRIDVTTGSGDCVLEPGS